MAVPLVDHPAPRPNRSVGIITPEAVVLEFETAGVASRLLARLLDGVVLWFALIIFAVALGSAGPVGSQTAGVIIVVLLGFFIVFGYWILFETLMQGRTLGKMAMGIRVVTVEGAPVRLGHSVIRAIVGLVDFLLPPLGPVAVISVLVTGRDQRLGDLAAGTIVLRERSSMPVAAAVHMTEPAGHRELMGRLQLARMTEPQHNLIRRFLVRTAKLTPDARHQLAVELAAAVETETGVARPTELHPEWYLHAAGLAHQRRAGFALAPDFSSTGPPPPPPVGVPYGGVSTPPPPAGAPASVAPVGRASGPLPPPAPLRTPSRPPPPGPPPPPGAP